MINVETIERIKQLETEYERNWNKKPDYLIMPRGITQESLVLVLERIVDTGESILVGWDKINHRGLANDSRGSDDT